MERDQLSIRRCLRDWLAGIEPASLFGFDDPAVAPPGLDAFLRALGLRQTVGEPDPTGNQQQQKQRRENIAVHRETVMPSKAGTILGGSDRASAP